MNPPAYDESNLTDVKGDLSILLVSKTGGGKSSLGNALLQLDQGDDRAFGVNDAMHSSAAECRVGTKTIEGRRITVVDTPGTMDTNHKERALHEIASAIVHCSRGFHVILLVIRLDCRFTAEEKMAVELVSKMFGEEFFKYCIVVFSHGDSIGNRTGEFFERLHESRSSISFLNNLLNSCGNRVALVDNSRSRQPEVQATQLTTLRQRMDQLVQGNGGTTFSNKYFQLARQELVREQMELTTEEKRKRDEFQRRVRQAGEVERQRLEAELQEQVRLLKEGMQARVTASIEQSVVMDNNTCFPADATVQTAEGRVRMSELRLGQRVLGRGGDGRPVYSPVYTWGHRDPDASPAIWVTVRTASGASVTLSSDHLLPLATGRRHRRAVAANALARQLRPGRSAVWTLDQRSGGLRCDLVTEAGPVTSREHRGLFAPFTLCGSLVVDGVLASCYVDCGLPAPLSHALLWPVRAAWRVWPAAVEAAGCPGDRGDGTPGWVRLAVRALRVLPRLRLLPAGESPDGDLRHKCPEFKI